jgi:hypothetical protein
VKEPVEPEIGVLVILPPVTIALEVERSSKYEKCC